MSAPLFTLLLLIWCLICEIFCQTTPSPSPRTFLRPTPETGPGRDISTSESPSNITGDTCCNCISRTREAGCPNDPVCEETICGTVNFRCCTRRWQDDCVDAALVICSNLDTCCGCLNIDNNNNGGCRNDLECTRQICEKDPFCCNENWDDICVLQSNAICSGNEIPPCCSCTSQTNFNGCFTDSICQNAICSEDPFCCDPEGQWDQLCVNTAVQVCQGIIPLPGTQQTSTTTISPQQQQQQE